MKNKVAIEKMLRYTEKAMTYCNGHTYESFVANDMVVEACVFDISQIGELCRHIDETFMNAHPEVPWHKMRGLRNRIVHDYDGINLIPVWETITVNFPELQVMLKKILTQMEEPSEEH